MKIIALALTIILTDFSCALTYDKPENCSNSQYYDTIRLACVNCPSNSMQYTSNYIKLILI